MNNQQIEANKQDAPTGVVLSDLLAAAAVKAKAAGRKYLYCGDFYDMEEWPGCCVSCHEDNEEYGYGLCSAEIDGMEVECCCKVSTWIGETQKAANAPGEPRR
jgi:hypothetical protein